MHCAEMEFQYYEPGHQLTLRLATRLYRKASANQRV